MLLRGLVSHCGGGLLSVCCSLQGSPCGRPQALGVWASGGEARGLSSRSLRALRLPGSAAVVHGLSCSMARRIFLDKGLNLQSPGLPGRFPSTVPPGNSSYFLKSPTSWLFVRAGIENKYKYKAFFFFNRAKQKFILASKVSKSN